MPCYPIRIGLQELRVLKKILEGSPLDWAIPQNRGLGRFRRSQRIMSGARSFPTTRWSLILSSAGDTRSQAADALAELCRVYWYPIYSFVRARSSSADQAQDLTQDFFLYLLKGTVFAAADPGAGRFRSFLIAALRNFLADQADWRNARKRGGGTVIVSIDITGAEERFVRDLPYNETPERIFDRQWALTLVSEACDQLRDALVREGKDGLFQHLRAFLPGGADPPSYANLAAELRTSESSVKVTIHRLRRRYRDLLRANVSHTLANPNDVDDEIRFLLDALSA
jgi:RNA polymerase sigma factor (sigma-70 family)